MLSGGVCDGASAYGAAQVAAAVNNGVFGYQRFCQGLQF